jgi:hypothetical protein
VSFVIEAPGYFSASSVYLVFENVLLACSTLAPLSHEHQKNAHISKHEGVFEAVPFKVGI